MIAAEGQMGQSKIDQIRPTGAKGINRLPVYDKPNIHI